jgi:hypothetical protein
MHRDTHNRRREPLPTRSPVTPCSHTAHTLGTGGPYDPLVPLLAPAEAGVAPCPTLGERDSAVLAVLLGHHGRVVDRSSLRHEAGLTQLSPRRCEAALVRLRAVLGEEAIVTVRRRGWMLCSDAVGAAAAIIGTVPA